MNGREVATGLFLAVLGVLAHQEYGTAGAADERSQSGVSPVATLAPANAMGGTRTAQADPLLAIPKRSDEKGKRDVFAPHSWTPKPPPAPRPKPQPVAEPPPPPPPTAPALTLVYLGQLEVSGESTVYYLAQGQRVLAVTVGDTIDGVYRVLPPEGRSLGLLYLPLNIKQLLPMRLPS